VSVPVSAPETPSAPPPEQSPVRWLGVAAAVLPIALILLAFGSRLMARNPSADGIGVNSIGQAVPIAPRLMPAVALKTMDGADFSLSEMRGKVTVVNFWSSWCVPCQEEAPALERAWQLAHIRGVEFVGINIWDPASDAQKFIRDYKISYTNAADVSGRIAIDLGVTGIPETYVINREGQIVRRWVGPVGEDRLLALVAEVEAGL
jgi:cytochrome c biogenesis protein CcmG, thiol:disulfide interchange protein DsbE